MAEEKEEEKKEKPVTKEEVEEIVEKAVAREMEKIKEATKELGRGLKEWMTRMEERLEKVAVPPAVVETAEVTTPAFPPRIPTFVEKTDKLTKEKYVTDIDFEFRAKALADLLGYPLPRIFFEVSDETRKKLGYPTIWEVVKRIYQHGSEKGIVSPSHLRAMGFTEEEIKKMMDD